MGKFESSLARFLGKVAWWMREYIDSVTPSTIPDPQLSPTNHSTERNAADRPTFLAINKWKLGMNKCYRGEKERPDDQKTAWISSTMKSSWRRQVVPMAYMSTCMYRKLSRWGGGNFRYASNCVIAQCN